MSFDQLVEVTGCQDVHRLDRKLDHLRIFELIGAGGFGTGGGFVTHETLDASINVSALALHLYVRGQGSTASPTEYFSLTQKPPAVVPETTEVKVVQS